MLPSSRLALPPTVLTAWTGTLLRALDARGIDGRALALQAGISGDALADPDRRVPLDASTRLWHAAVAATGDPALGLDVSRFVRPATFHALGQAFVASPTLRAALERTARFSEVTADIATVSAVATPDGFSLTIAWRPGVDPPAFEAVDGVVASIVRAARFMLDRSATPIRVQLERPAPVPDEPFTAFFRCPIVYSSAPNVVVFGTALVERPVPAASPGLARANDDVVSAYLAGLVHDRVSDRVRAAILERLANGEPTVGDVAHALNMSARSLQRRLRDEATTFTTLTEAVRGELARAYLRAGEHSITEITYLLGYQETAAFSRAFRRWTGVAPSRYR